MNMMALNRVIGIQEAQYGLMKMPLTLSSELPYYLDTTTKMKLSVDHQGTNMFDLKSCYSKRNPEFHSMNLATFFYTVNKKRLITSNAFRNPYLNDCNMVLPTRNPILFPRSRNIRTTYPVTFEYAKAMMMMYVPWSQTNTLDSSNKSNVILEFESSLTSGYFPTAVATQYRAEFYHKNKQLKSLPKRLLRLILRC